MIHFFRSSAPSFGHSDPDPGSVKKKKIKVNENEKNKVSNINEKKVRKKGEKYVKKGENSKTTQVLVMSCE